MTTSRSLTECRRPGVTFEDAEPARIQQLTLYTMTSGLPGEGSFGTADTSSYFSQPRMVEANGVDLCIQTIGDTADPAILLIAGAAISMDWWEDDFCERLNESIADLELRLEILAGLTSGERIEASDRMIATLTGNGFDVSPLSSRQQPVLPGRRTEWAWEIDPTQPGPQTLLLVLTAVIGYGNGEALGADDLILDQYTVETFSRTLTVENVRAHPSVRLREFVSRNWQWLMTALVIPGVLWLVRRRRTATPSEK